MSDPSASSSVVRPPIFSGKSSFSAWKHKVLAYLQSIGLKEVVVQPLAEAQVQSSKAASAVASKSEKAYAILVNLLDDSLIELISSVPSGDAAGVWTVLLDTYENKSTAQLCTKLDELMNLKFESSKESFDLFKARFTHICTDLKEMGEVISPKIQRYVLLRSMPAGYGGLVQSLKINESLTFDQVCVHIKDHYESEKRKQDRGGAADHGDHAYMFRQKHPSNRECYLCGRSGHLASACTLKAKMWCSMCRSTGHTSKHCEAAAVAAAVQF